MKKQPYPIVDITGGLQKSKDPTFLLDKENPNLLNTRIYQGLLRKDVGMTIFSNDLPLDGTPMFIETFYKQDGTMYLLVCTTEWIYEYDVNNDTFTIINPSDMNSEAQTLTFDASEQTVVGSPLLFGTSFDLGEVTGSLKCAALSSTRIALTYYTATNNYLTTYDWNGSTWSQVGNPLVISQCDALDALSYTDVALFSTLDHYLRRFTFDGTDWSQVGNALYISGTSPAIATMSSNDIAMASSSDWLRWYSWDGSDWAQVGNSLTITGMGNPAITHLYNYGAYGAIAIIDDSLEVLRTIVFDGTDWGIVSHQVACNITGITSPTITKLSENTIAFIDDTLESLRCYRYDATPNWEQLGNGLNISGISYPSITTLENSKIAFVDSTLDELRQYHMGNFLVKGFAVDDVIDTDTTLNPGNFIIAAVEAIKITVSSGIIDEGPVSAKTIYRMSALTGDESNSFCSATTLTSAGDDVIFLTNGLDKVMKWLGSGRFDTIDIYAKQLEVFQNRLILGFVIDGGTACPRRVQWSVIGDPEDFSGTGSGFLELVDTPDWVSSLVAFRGKLFTIKERSIWELVYLGGYIIFTLALKIDGVGTVSPGSVINLGEEIIFYGNDNIYTYNGLALTAIADQLFPILYDTEKKIVNSIFLDRCVGLFVEELEEYWLSIPTKGSQPSLLLKYNFKHKSFNIKNTEASALGYYSIIAYNKWSELVGLWSAQDWHWMDRELPSGAPTTLIATADGNIYEDDRITYDNEYMFFETKDWMFAHAQRWVEFRVTVKGGDFQLSYSIDQGLTWSAPVLFTSTQTTEFETFTLFLNVTSQHIRCKVESYAEDLIIKWIEPWFIPRQRAL